jgi:DNA repair exonuclease SbcCD nuclease subunit
MRVLVIGDQHFKSDNLMDVQVFLTKLEAHLDSKHYDLIISAGDLLDSHEKVFTQPLNRAIAYCRLLSRHAPTYVLVGNHDYISNNQRLTDEHWLNVMKDWKSPYPLTVVDRLIKIDTDEGFFLACPYVPDGQLIGVLDELENWQQARAIFAHQTLDGVKMGMILVQGVEQWQPEYPLLICGHIHQAQQPQPNLIYVGSALSVAYGDTEDKTISAFTWRSDNLAPRQRKIDLDLPRRLTQYMSLSDVKRADTQALRPAEGDHLRLTLSGTKEEFSVFRRSKKFAELEQAGIKIHLRQNKAIEPIPAPVRQALVASGVDLSDDKPAQFRHILSSLIQATGDERAQQLLQTLLTKIDN